MKKASEYRRHAEECHALAKGMTGQQRDQLVEMRLAEDRAALVKRHPELAVDGEADEEAVTSRKEAADAED